MHGIIIFTAIIFFLWIARSILIPLLIAGFLWYLMNAISDYYRRVLPYKAPTTKTEKAYSLVFDWVSYIATFATVFLVGYLFATQIRPMFSELFSSLPAIQEKLTRLGTYLSDSIGLTFDSSMIPNITKIAANIGTSVAGIATSFGMVLVYMIFMFVEQSTFDKKFSAMFPARRQYKKMRYILDSIDTNMKKYLFVKTAISAITGIASFIWLQMIGVEFAGVWAFIVFITSYIPTIGAIVACSLPILYSLVSAPTLQQPILTAIGLIGLQILFGNILEPKLTGKTLNLSTLAILINLVVWGLIWGIAGMFFSVPMLVAIYIICAQFDSTRWVAVLLSADGNIPDKNDDQ
ncbi:MAG: AI-2E family transporter [Alphaproteobacteria bacterium]|nr:AI-2E family transporter [Alphaproteobacteria bacterium]